MKTAIEFEECYFDGKELKWRKVEPKISSDEEFVKNLVKEMGAKDAMEVLSWL